MKQLLTLTLTALLGSSVTAQVTWDAVLTGNCNEQNTGETAVISETGATYFAGHFRGNLFMGFNSAAADNTNDVFLGKGDASGNVNWLESFGSDNYVDVADMVVSGNSIILGGTFSDSLILGNDTMINTVQKGIYLAEFDTLGNYVRSFAPDCQSASIHGITIDSSGHILVTGDFNTSIDFGSEILTTSGGFNFYLFKYDFSQDSVYWSVASTGATTLGDQVSVDPTGNIYVAGSYGNGVTLDTVTLTNDNTNHNIFVCSYDSDGNFRWVRQFYGLAENHGYGIAVSREGTVFLTGEFETQLEFDVTSILFSSGSYDVIVCALDSMGNFIWDRGFGGSDSDEGYHITTDENGDAILLCETGPGITLDGTPYEPNGFNEPFLLKLHHADGSVIWGQRIHAETTTGLVQASQVSYSKGKAVVVGTNRSRIDHYGNMYTAPNLKDFYLTFFSDSLTYTLDAGEHFFESPEMVAFPNPFSSDLSVRLPFDAEVTITDMGGRTLMRLELKSGTHHLPLNTLKNGAYVVLATNGEQVLRQVVVKR